MRPRKSTEFIELLFANITRWGDMSSGFMSRVDVKRAQLLGFSELHAKHRSVAARDIDGTCRANDRRPFYTTIKGKAESHATGVLLAPRTGVMLRAQPPSLKELCFKGFDFISVIICLRGVDVLVVRYRATFRRASDREATMW